MKKKPNIIFIITDDQGAWAVESETNHDIKTPNLTRLAAQGTTFDEFYCTSPVCSPAQSQHCNWKNPFLPWYPRLAEKRQSGCMEIPPYGCDGRFRHGR